MSNAKRAFPLSVVAISVLCAASVWAAGPDPGVNVTVTNPPSNPVPVSIQGSSTPIPVTTTSTQTPFQVLICTPGCQGGGANDPTTKFHVPANARLVIEYVSVYCGTVVNFVEIETTVGGTVIGHFPGIPEQSRPGGPFISAQKVRIYADPDTNVIPRQDVPATLAACNMQLSGYLSPK
jgi:hypothetical protein